MKKYILDLTAVKELPWPEGCAKRIPILPSLYDFDWDIAREEMSPEEYQALADFSSVGMQSKRHPIKINNKYLPPGAVIYVL